MALSNYAVYNEQLQTNVIELVQQKVDAFNAASGGAIVLSGDLQQGDYIQEAYWKNIDSALRDVDAYAALSTASETQMEQEEVIGVKKAGAFGPVAFKDADLTWLARSPEEATVAIAEGFANALLKYQLNTCLAAAVAAFENNADAVSDLSASAGVSQTGLNKQHALFGDASQSLICDVMSGATMHALIEKGLANGENLFEAGNVTVQNILGKIVVVTDSNALFEAGTPNKAKVLSLTSAGIVVEGGNDIITNLEKSNGNTRIKTTWQADFSFTVSLKGYKWDSVNGGKSPLNAEIATGSNWDAVAASVKNTGGVVGVYDSEL